MLSMLLKHNSKMFLVKQHVHQRRLFLTVIDSSLQGKVLEDAKRKIDIDAYACDERLEREEVLPLLEKAEVVQVIGKNAIALGEGRFEQVDEVQGVPYAFVM